MPVMRERTVRARSGPDGSLRLVRGNAPRARGRVLLVEEDVAEATRLAESGPLRGFTVEVVGSLDAALSALAEDGRVEVVVTQLAIGDAERGSLADAVVREHPGVPVLVRCSLAAVRAAIEAVRRGAYDVVLDPVDPNELARTLDRAVEHARSVAELRHLRATRAGRSDGILFRSSVMQRVVDTVERVAKSDVTVLITGESGTGKELVARSLHRMSPRADAPFVPINCAAMPEPLLESELFGHTRGAFTDAHAARTGLFARAHGGVLFLDEIGEMPLTMQAKLLRVLQEGRVRPVGDDVDHPVDVRIVAATHRNLDAEVLAGRFREDLYFRIHVVEIPLPALRARGDDALLLAHEFLSRACARTGRTVPMMTPTFARLLLAYDWPGNVRELTNVMEAALALSDGGELRETALPDRVRSFAEARVPAREAGGESTSETHVLPLEDVERRHILYAMRLLRGNKKLVAEALGLDRSTLYRKLLKYGVHELRESEPDEN